MYEGAILTFQEGNAGKIKARIWNGEKKPFEFAYALLEPQAADPKAKFKEALDTGEETVVYLKNPVQVHLIYRTAFVDELGVINYRRDIYGRDAAIYEALIDAGIEAKPLSG